MLRKQERMREIGELIAQERSLIMDLSSNLSEMHSTVKISASASAKSSKSGYRGSSRGGVTTSAFVNLNYRFLLACELINFTFKK